MRFIVKSFDKGIQKEYTILIVEADQAARLLYLNFWSMAKMYRDAEGIEFIILKRYAIIGEGGSQLILLFEADVWGETKQYMGPTKIEGDPMDSLEQFKKDVYAIIDKDLTVSLKCANRIFKGAEYDRELKEKEKSIS